MFSENQETNSKTMVTMVFLLDNDCYCIVCTIWRLFTVVTLKSARTYQLIHMTVTLQSSTCVNTAVDCFWFFTPCDVWKARLSLCRYIVIYSCKFSL